MRSYIMQFFLGEKLVSSIKTNHRNGKKALEEYNSEDIPFYEADRCIVYTSSMSRLSDVRLVKREGLPDAYVYYPI